jgi:hypothetical protein
MIENHNKGLPLMNKIIYNGLTTEQFAIIMSYADKPEKMATVKQMILDNNFEIWHQVRLFNLAGDYTQIAYMGF